MGAAFIAQFVDGRPYTHIDIAGPSFYESPLSEFGLGGTGAGTQALISLFDASL